MERQWSERHWRTPWGSTAPPGAAYFFSVDRKGEHPQRHLAEFSGILQADAYSGFKALYNPDASGKPRVREAACWAHLRRVRGHLEPVAVAAHASTSTPPPNPRSPARRWTGSANFMTSSVKSTINPAMPDLPAARQKPARKSAPSRHGQRRNWPASPAKAISPRLSATP